MTWQETQDLRKLWKVIDKLDTAARDVESGHLSLEHFHEYARRQLADALRAVSFPGEPLELTGAEVGRILRDIAAREAGSDAPTEEQ